MRNVLLTIGSLSVAGSVLALLLFACRPLLKNRVSKAFSYYIWLLVLLRFVLPVPALGALEFPAPQLTGAAVTELADQAAGSGAAQAVVSQQPQTVTGDRQNEAAADRQTAVPLWELIQTNLFWIWLAGACAGMGWFSVGYVRFSRRILRSCVPPHGDDLAVFCSMRKSCRTRLACSSYVSTPMLLGLFRPVVILPQFAYVQNGRKTELEQLLRHELIHDRRKDILYKWAVAAIASVHWFNPLLLLIRREIGRACELSCDEAAVRGMSDGERRTYGEMLLAFSAGKGLPAAVPATMLCEEKEALKERLIGIMRDHKRSVRTVLPALLLTLVLAGCGAVLGVPNGTGNSDANSRSLTDGTAYSRTMNGTILNWYDNGCSYELTEDGGVIFSYENGAVTARAPLTLSGASGVYLSEEKTAVASSAVNTPGPVTVLISDDRGETWETAEVEADSAVTWIKIGFTTRDDGWMVLCSFVGMGAEDHFLYRTNDGGKTWTLVESNIDEVYGRMLSGAGFVNDEVGLLCFRYEDLEFEPAVCITRDGGATWKKLSLDLPEEYDGYSKTAFSPRYDGTELILPVLLSDDNGDVGTVTLTSGDLGETWQCGEDFDRLP